jgi:hypothetical protein
MHSITPIGGRGREGRRTQPPFVSSSLTSFGLGISQGSKKATGCLAQHHPEAARQTHNVAASPQTPAREPQFVHNHAAGPRSTRVSRDDRTASPSFAQAKHPATPFQIAHRSLVCSRGTSYAAPPTHIARFRRLARPRSASRGGEEVEVLMQQPVHSKLCELLSFR